MGGVRLLLGLSGKRLLERERSEPSHSAKLLSASSDATDRVDAESPERLLLGAPSSCIAATSAADSLSSHSAWKGNAVSALVSHDSVTIKLSVNSFKSETYAEIAIQQALLYVLE